MKQILTIFIFSCSMLLPGMLTAQQFSVRPGSNFLLKAGTLFCHNGIGFNPVSDYTLTGIELTNTATPNNNPWGISIARVYKFNNATGAYNGTLRINYQDVELNGIGEDSLYLNVYNGSCWKSYPASSKNTSSNFFESTISDGPTLKEITLGRYIHPGPAITKQPVDNSITYSCNVPAFTISVADAGTPTYQWYSNSSKTRTGGTLITGATDSSFKPAVSAIGTYYYYAVVSSSCGKDTSKAVSLVISAQTANPGTDIYYTGPSMAWTSGSNSNNASVILSATIVNSLGCGDIRTAKITFAIRNADNSYTPLAGAQNLPVSYVDPARPEYGGTASAKVQFTISSSAANQIYSIAVIVSGNYTANNPVYDGTLNIARPTPGGLIAGCVKLCNDQSAGYFKGATTNGFCPVYTRMAFGVQYSKSGANPKGVVDITIRSYNRPDGTTDAVLHTYRIKSNSIVSLSVNGTKGTASFTSKANVFELFADGTLTSIEGNSTMTFEMTDKGDQLLAGAVKDSVALTINRNKGGLWYSNNWVPSLFKTATAAICGGDVNVQGSSSGAVVTGLVNYTIASEDVPKLEVYVMNNPTYQLFRFMVKGSHDQVRIRVVDVRGMLVEIRDGLMPGRVFELGAMYLPGTYFAEVIQGSQRRVVKLVKQ